MSECKPIIPHRFFSTIAEPPCATHSAVIPGRPGEQPPGLLPVQGRKETLHLQSQIHLSEPQAPEQYCVFPDSNFKCHFFQEAFLDPQSE
jgi:hypothetical protein